LSLADIEAIETVESPPILEWSEMVKGEIYKSLQ